LAVFYRDVVIYDNICQEAGCRRGRSGTSGIAITPVDGLDAVPQHFCHVRDVEGRDEAHEDAGGTRTTEIALLAHCRQDIGNNQLGHTTSIAFSRNATASPDGQKSGQATQPTGSQHFPESPFFVKYSARPQLRLWDD
jgi:hypothetical protein